MKVCFFTHYTALYGANRSLLDLLDGLVGYGIIVHVMLPENGPIEAELQRRGIDYQILPFHSDTYVRKGFSRIKGGIRHLRNLWSFRQIKAAVASIEPDVIYTNSAVILTGAKVAAALELPHVWHIRELYHITIEQAFNLGHRSFLYWLRKSACAVAISEMVREQIITDETIPSKVIYNGVIGERTLKEYEQRRYGMRRGEALVTFVIMGRIEAGKGQEEAIEAFAKASKSGIPMQLWIAGEGDTLYTHRLKSLAKRLGISDFTRFWGYIQKPFEIWLQADVGLMCSKHEAMGRVTAEAMAIGVPVIGYRGGATPELISDGQDGILYQETAELVEAMVRIASEVEWRNRLGSAARQKARKMFTKEQYARQVFELLERIVVAKEADQDLVRQID